MCLIIHKPESSLEISREMIDQASWANPDGFGITYLDGGETLTDLDMWDCEERMMVDRPYVAHFRYATKGEVNLHNCHPFPIDSGGRRLLFSNGTVEGLGSDTSSDTEETAKKLNNTPRRYWKHILSMTPTRFAVVDTRTGHVSRYGDWEEEGGVFHSNSSCLGLHDIGEDLSMSRYLRRGMAPSPDVLLPKDGAYLSVYGTLKAGHGNHGILGASEFVGHGTSKEKLLMWGEGVPYVREKPCPVRGSNIKVEVYRVPDQKTWQDLDWLEGVPYHYDRGTINLDMEDGSSLKTIIYYSVEPPTRKAKFYSEF